MELHEQNFLYEDASVAFASRVNVEAGTINRAHILGPVSKHGYRYSVEAMKAAAPLFEGMPIGINHAYDGSPLKVADTWGSVSSPVCDDQGIWGDISYLRKHPLTEQVMEDLQRGTTLFSLSAVNGNVIENKKVVTSFRPMRLDLVAGGATTTTLLEQAPVEEVKAEEPDPLLIKIEQMQAQINEMEKRLVLKEQFVTPNVTETIKAATVAVDLKKYWNDFKKD